MPTTTTPLASMTRDALGHVLRERKSSLLHCLAGLREESDHIVHTRDVSDLFDHQDPSGDTDFELAQALTHQVEAYLAAVDDALARVENGSYGFCTECGHRMPLDRLSVLPTAKHCLACSAARRTTT